MKCFFLDIFKTLEIMFCNELREVFGLKSQTMVQQ